MRTLPEWPPLNPLGHSPCPHGNDLLSPNEIHSFLISIAARRRSGLLFAVLPCGSRGQSLRWDDKGLDHVAPSYIVIKLRAGAQMHPGGQNSEPHRFHSIILSVYSIIVVFKP